MFSFNPRPLTRMLVIGPLATFFAVLFFSPAQHGFNPIFFQKDGVFLFPLARRSRLTGFIPPYVSTPDINLVLICAVPPRVFVEFEVIFVLFPPCIGRLSIIQGVFRTPWTSCSYFVGILHDRLPFFLIFFPQTVEPFFYPLFVFFLKMWLVLYTLFFPSSGLLSLPRLSLSPVTATLCIRLFKSQLLSLLRLRS